MSAFVIRRILLALVTLAGITLVTFLMVHLVPGSPVGNEIDTGSSIPVPAEYVRETRRLYGLDRPIVVQYADWVRRAATLDFGESLRDHRRVLAKVWEAARVTIELQAIAIVLVFALGIPIGVWCAARFRRPLERVTSAALLGLYSLPTFWIATLALVFLGGRAFPAGGLSSDDAESLAPLAWLTDRAWHLALPVACLTVLGVAVVSRYARSGVLEALRADFVRTARAKGLAPRAVLWSHALRNGLLPLLTLVGAILPTLVGGSLVVERVFRIPGMGNLAYEAARNLDYPVLLAITTITGALTIAGFVVSDLLYAWADPRIRLR
ncbi:MAG: ABC transporter permease [Planctomycetes bacterium]|nr:ABC transporter permease [Planctomycetota bacterium]MBI3848371.1 ABC transporter permease [Planctomycetota bacterium]